MKELFIKHKTIILRSLGALMLLIGFVVYFWVTPKEGVSANEIAAANVARMEAKVAGGSSSSKSKSKHTESPFMKKFKETQEKQFRYMTIILMILGVGFLGYSFIKPRLDSER